MVAVVELEPSSLAREQSWWLQAVAVVVPGAQMMRQLERVDIRRRASSLQRTAATVQPPLLDTTVVDQVVAVVVSMAVLVEPLLVVSEPSITAVAGTAETIS